MNKLCSSVLAIISISMIVFTGVGAAAGKKGRVLVLGFDSIILNEVQDRLLRESVLRELHERGFAIVPVMELESFFGADSIKDIRRVDEGQAREYCRELRARYAIYGLIKAGKGMGNPDEIIPGGIYQCIVYVYMLDRNKTVTKTVTVTAKESIYEFNKDLSKKIVSAFKKMR